MGDNSSGIDIKKLEFITYLCKTITYVKVLKKYNSLITELIFPWSDYLLKTQLLTSKFIRKISA